MEVRQYSNLFTVTEPSDKWEEEINPDSEVIYADAVVDPSIASLCDASKTDRWNTNVAFQFER